MAELDDAGRDFLLARIRERQGVNLSTGEGAALLRFSRGADETMAAFTGKLDPDGEPAGYARALRELRLEPQRERP